MRHQLICFFFKIAVGGGLAPHNRATHSAIPGASAIPARSDCTAGAGRLEDLELTFENFHLKAVARCIHAAQVVYDHRRTLPENILWRPLELVVFIVKQLQAGQRAEFVRQDCEDVVANPEVLDGCEVLDVICKKFSKVSTLLSFLSLQAD